MMIYKAEHMKDLEKFAAHLETLSLEEWERLFAILPQIQWPGPFGKVVSGEGKYMPYYKPSRVVTDTLDILNDLQLIPVFAWNYWQEGRSILDNKKTDYKKLDVITLCKLLTVIVRTDRFSEGYLIAQFDNGIMAKIIEALQYNIQHPESREG